MRRLAQRGLRFVRGRLRRTDGHPEAGQEVRVGRRHLVGHRLCGTQSAGCVHEDQRVQRLDQPDTAVLSFLRGVVLGVGLMDGKSGLVVLFLEGERDARCT